VLLSFEKGEHKSPAHLARSPHGKVPALEDDGVSLYESSAIVEYLEERYPRTPLLPPDPAERARVRSEALECLLYFTERFFPHAQNLGRRRHRGEEPERVVEDRVHVARGEARHRVARHHHLIARVHRVEDEVRDRDVDRYADRHDGPHAEVAQHGVELRAAHG